MLLNVHFCFVIVKLDNKKTKKGKDKTKEVMIYKNCFNNIICCNNYSNNCYIFIFF